MIWRVRSTAKGGDLMDFQARKCYIQHRGQAMVERPETVTHHSTAAYIRGLAAQHNVTYVQTQSDVLAQHMTRLADDAIQPDEIECMLFALHRAGHLDRHQLVHLQVKYLRETKP
jgi:hypothetical protein